MTPIQLRHAALVVLMAEQRGDGRFVEFIRAMCARTSMSPTMVMARVRALAALS